MQVFVGHRSPKDAVQTVLSPVGFVGWYRNIPCVQLVRGIWLIINIFIYIIIIIIITIIITIITILCIYIIIYIYINIFRITIPYWSTSHMRSMVLEYAHQHLLPKITQFCSFLYTSTIFCESGYCLSSICILSMFFPVPFRLVWCLAEAPLLCSMQFNISRWPHVSWIPPWWNFMVNIWVNGENPAFTWFIEFPNLSL